MAQYGGSATAQYGTNERRQILEWFENDFKETAKRTTQTSRLEDGKVSYKFSVVNNSGYSFSNFSFRVRILNKATGKEIGSATINAGSWASGETKNFKSKIAIPQDVKSISFVMYSESVDYEIDQVRGSDDSVSSALKDIGNMVTGADGSGGVFGELFGTGGMPETSTTTTTTTRTPSGTTTRTTTTTRTSDGRVREKTTTTRQTSTTRSRNVQTQRTPGQSYVKRKNDKRLNKKRLGKSGWTVTALVFGILFAMAALADSNTSAEIIEYFSLSGICLATSLGLKLSLGGKAKRIRAYESRVNMNGNTSIDELASYVGRKPDKVADDLQKMIVDGFFPEAYVDINNRLLVMTRNGEPIESPEKTAAANKVARRKAAREKGVVPETIDDLITMTDDSQIKTKLKELRTITRKIDQRVEERPDLTNQVKEFREKFYPEVVRLTDEYNEKIANLDSGSGREPDADKLEINANPNYLQEQAREIKEQLIKLIDSVTEASENLLEKLHEDDIMDITTDIQMLQTTLASKGLLDSDFDL